MGTAGRALVHVSGGYGSRRRGIDGGRGRKATTVGHANAVLPRLAEAI